MDRLDAEFLMICMVEASHPRGKTPLEDRGPLHRFIECYPKFFPMDTVNLRRRKVSPHRRRRRDKERIIAGHFTGDFLSLLERNVRIPMFRRIPCEVKGSLCHCDLTNVSSNKDTRVFVSATSLRLRFIYAVVLTEN